jgi:hypothetical protein
MDADTADSVTVNRLAAPRTDPVAASATSVRKRDSVIAPPRSRQLLSDQYIVTTKVLIDRLSVERQARNDQRRQV